MGYDLKFRPPSRAQRPILQVTAMALLILIFLRLRTRGSGVGGLVIAPKIDELKNLPSPTYPYAFATFLDAPEIDYMEDNDDNYFIATRMLIYQFLHDPSTRTQENYPFLVLVTEDVKQSKRDRLVRDGAQVIPVAKVDSPWIKSRIKRWRDVLAKLHMFELTQFERIAFFDSDMLLIRNMDGIFGDEGAQLMPHLKDPSRVNTIEDNNSSINATSPLPPPEPENYVFAAITGQGNFDHPYPQRKGRSLNSGVVVFKPSIELFNIYMHIVQHGEGRFDPKFPEQNLWNYVHRHNGNMPWQYLQGDWNTNWATIRDVENGFASLHAKWFESDHDTALRDLLLRVRWKMEGYFQRMDMENKL